MSETFLGKKLCLGVKLGHKLGTTFWQSFNLNVFLKDSSVLAAQIPCDRIFSKVAEHC